MPPYTVPACSSPWLTVLYVPKLVRYLPWPLDPSPYLEALPIGPASPGHAPKQLVQWQAAPGQSLWKGSARPVRCAGKDMGMAKTVAALVCCSIFRVPLCARCAATTLPYAEHKAANLVVQHSDFDSTLDVHNVNILSFPIQQFKLQMLNMFK